MIERIQNGQIEKFKTMAIMSFQTFLQNPKQIKFSTKRVSTLLVRVPEIRPNRDHTIPGTDFACFTARSVVHYYYVRCLVSTR